MLECSRRASTASIARVIVLRAKPLSAMTVKERRRFQRRDSSRLSEQSREWKSSVFVVALLIGLIFCLANVAVILMRLDTSSKAQDDASHVSPTHHHHHQQQQQQQTNNKLMSLMDTDALKPVIKNKLSKQERVAIEQEKAPVLEILKQAGVMLDDLGDAKLQELPTWNQVTSLYGHAPKIYGLETCEAFQQQRRGDAADHFVGTAGTFNSGTNLMSELMIHNCQMTARMKKYGKVNKGIRWQVPWGKHTPVGNDEYRLSHVTEKDKGVDPNNILPAVTIRDPYVWMQSMCRIHYKAFWAHDNKSENRHCPNLVPTEMDRRLFPFLRDKDHVPVRVKYPEFVQQHDSLVGFWNDWYNDYMNASFPRLIVRFEDLVFHAKDVVTQVCHCAGGEMKKKTFTYIVDSAKKGDAAHGPQEARTSLVDAMIRYGKDTGRLKYMTKDDLQYAREHLDPKLMEFFNYQYDDIR